MRSFDHARVCRSEQRPTRGAQLMRFLSLDLGDKRTGLATGDSVTRLAGPAGVIELPLNAADNGARLLDAIMKVIDDDRPAGIVIGLPLNMDATEGPASKKVRDFAARIAQRANLPIHFQDERLTTREADWTMAQSGLTHAQKKARRDALAAAAILRDFLASDQFNRTDTESPDEN